MFTIITEYLQTTTFDDGVKYFAFYVSPYTKFESDAAKKSLYYLIKEKLLYRDISMQAVERQKLTGNFEYSVSNIAIAMIAKLGGVPWKLDAGEADELVIGFGAFRSMAPGLHYTGSAVCFTQDGRFREFDVFPADDVRSVAGTAMRAFLDYREKFPQAKRMTIHFFKRMSKRELEPIEKMLRELRLDIPVVVAGTTY